MEFDFLFYVVVGFLYIAVLGSAIGVIAAKNLVYSVFYTISTTFFSTLILFILKAEFLAIIYIIIYVGAIAILFLFVIMMMNVRVIELKESLVQYIPLSIALAVFLLFEVYYMVFNEFNITHMFLKFDWVSLYVHRLNMQVLGTLLYNHFGVSFFVSGLLLLLAMIGSIVLTAYHEKRVLRQDILRQVEQTYTNTIRFIK